MEPILVKKDLKKIGRGKRGGPKHGFEQPKDAGQCGTGTVGTETENLEHDHVGAIVVVETICRGAAVVVVVVVVWNGVQNRVGRRPQTYILIILFFCYVPLHFVAVERLVRWDI